MSTLAPLTRLISVLMRLSIERFTNDHLTSKSSFGFHTVVSLSVVFALVEAAVLGLRSTIITILETTAFFLTDMHPVNSHFCL